MMKTLTFVLTLIILSLSVDAQSIKDYYIPKRPNNRVALRMSGQSSGYNDKLRILYYTAKGTYYEIVDAQLIDNKLGTHEIKIVEFTPNEIKMTKSVLSNMFEKNKTSVYDPARIVLKMPVVGKSVNWTYTDSSGDNIICSAVWSSVIIDGIQKRAIKTTEQTEGLNSKIIALYVKDYGLYKTQIEGSGGRITPMDDFLQIDYDPASN